MFVRVAVLAVALAGPLAAGRSDEPKKAADPKAPTFKLPKGWEAVEDKKIAGIEALRFRAGAGDGAVSIVLMAAGGDLGANVNRWRAQLGLAPLDADGVKKAVEAVKVDGRDAHLMDATGREIDGKPAQRIVALVIPHGDRTWFLRMSGPAASVGDQKKAFDEFAKSLRLGK